jgi:tetratricopeptide (TPR) repeat protein
MDAKLAREIQLNPAFAVAYTNLAEVRAALKKPLEDVAGLLGRAVALEPGNAWHRIAVARVLWRYDRPEDARAAAKLALTLADTDQARSEAQRLLSSIK